VKARVLGEGRLRFGGLEEIAGGAMYTPEDRKAYWAALTPEQRSIPPALKTWIDNVIVPALVDQWVSREATKAA
jgi:hypothetical protein